MNGVILREPSMKALLLFALLSGLALAVDPVVTNARLPDDKPISTQPQTAPDLKITAKFKTDTVASEIVQGNWVSTEHVLTYEITEPVAGFPHKELLFVCRHQHASPDSGIREKRAPWPFREGKMTFAVFQDATVRHTAYFDIFRYDSVEPQK